VDEGAMLAREAARRATRLGRAVRNDPVPYIVGAIGLALIASFAFRRRH
jgi:hypothetical protein